MREAADSGVLIKGGKFMEAIARADVVVFDKTGTLTRARPTLMEVIPFGGRGREEVLRLAACLEEHFPHPVGQAIVRAAEKEGLKHREEHTQVEFIVAHGIASTWREQRVLIGSSRFVVEDQGIAPDAGQQAVIDREAEKGRTVLYLGMGDKLAGILSVEDEIRDNAAVVVQTLRASGVRRVIMLTGDGEKTASGVAAKVGIDEFRARMLPDDKAAFIHRLKREGCHVAMIGDGINDSPALSAAHVGVAMAEGADVAREVADIVLTNGDLSGLVLVRKLAQGSLRKIHSCFHISLFWNSVFLAGGLLGMLRPGLSAFLHNATTAAIAVSSLQSVLPAALPAEARAKSPRGGLPGRDESGISEAAE
jgi:Cu2+-exporting ATPase